MPLSAHQGEKPEDTQANQCILAKLHAFHDWNLCICVCVCELSHSVMSDSATLWTVAPQAPLSLGLFRQESGNGLPVLPPRDLPDSGIEHTSSAIPHWQADSLPLSHQGSP